MLYKSVSNDIYFMENVSGFFFEDCEEPLGGTATDRYRTSVIKSLYGETRTVAKKMLSMRRFRAGRRWRTCGRMHG